MCYNTLYRGALPVSLKLNTYCNRLCEKSSTNFKKSIDRCKMLCYNNICKARCSEENSYFNFDLIDTVFDYSHQIMSEVQKTDTSDIDKWLSQLYTKKKL